MDQFEYNSEEEVHPVPPSINFERPMMIRPSNNHVQTRIAISSIVVLAFVLLGSLSSMEKTPPNVNPDQFRSTLRYPTYTNTPLDEGDVQKTKNGNASTSNSGIYNDLKKEARVDSISRPFLPWSGEPEAWCINKADFTTTKPAGLFYVKVPKTASTTSASVNLQISNRHGKRMRGHEDEACHAFHHHVQAKKRGFQNRDVNKSILWTTIREPTKRAMSFAFFAPVSRHSMEPTDVNMIAFLEKIEENFQLNYISTVPLEWETGAQNTKKRDAGAVEKVIQDYDFIAITERMEESFVTMKLLFGLDFADIMFFSAKVSGGWDNGREGKGCTKIVPTFISANVGSYLASDEWLSKNSADFLLYEAANRSLDKTIAQFDVNQFTEELQQYHLLVQQVQEICADKIIFRCTEDGVFQEKESERNCYSRDEGCGYQCIDEFIRLRVEENQPFSIVKKIMSKWKLPVKTNESSILA
jgi:hypothetical protein